MRTGDGQRLNDIVWLRADGQAMEHDAWAQPLRGRAVRRSGCTSTATASPARTPAASTITDDHFLLYFNAGDALEVTLPSAEYAETWDVVIDTGGSADDSPVCKAGSTLPMASHSLVVLREHSEPEAEPDHSVAASVAARSEPGNQSSTRSRGRG